MTQAIKLPEQGQLVQVRQRRYLVVEVAQNPLPANVLKPGKQARSEALGQHLVTLSSVEDDALGEELAVIWELEPGATSLNTGTLPKPTGFDEPHRLDAFLNAVRWGAASSADSRALQAPFRSGVDLEDYQLDPVARAIGMPRANLLIADDVGLGKTIEAGLVAQELIIRHRARKIMIVCPASLQIQWRDQMRDKFGLEFRIVDSELLKILRRERGLRVNPWTHFPRLITSIDFLKRERPLRLLTEALPAEGEPAYPRRFDLLIVDEAHNIAPSGRGKYATDSQRTQALRRLAPHFEHKLFLSATPHNGYSESFTALLELLDNQRFARGMEPDREQLARVMVRRLKSEMKSWDGTARFPERRLEALEVQYTEAEREAHRLLNEYAQLRIKGATTETERYATEFVLKLLKKRLFSSPEAFALTLEKHEETLANARKRTVSVRPSAGILRRQLEALDEDADNDEDLEEAAASALEAAAPLFHPPTPRERELLDRLGAWANKTRLRQDSKATRLLAWLKEIVRPGGNWSNERVIIFTEYRATQKWLLGLLAAENMVANDRVMTLYGGMTTEDRERVKAAFQAHPSEAPVRILLATDAASEGIDLQNHCSRLIHYEIPWNPNRLEQRNGRIDRHGQKAGWVNIFHFVGSNYHKSAKSDLEISAGDLEGDLEFLMRAVQKVNRIREDLGKVGPVIAEQVEEAMLGQRRRLDTFAAEDKAAGVRRLLAFERKLQDQVARLHEQLQESRRTLQLSPENVQSVVEIALELAGQPPLRREILHDPNGEKPPIEVFHLPSLKGSWAACANGLEHPHSRHVRPVVFDHAKAKGRDDVVLAHLNHRLVSMSLRLLRAEVWTPDGQRKLHRVTARVVPDSVLSSPAVIAHARLMLTGGDSQRLHEEIIFAGGQIKEGRFNRLNVTEAQRILAAATVQSVPEKVQQQLTALWESNQASLQQALEVRSKERSGGLQKLLAERAEKEIKDITFVLSELHKSILEGLKQPEMVQLQMFNNEEKEQFERNISALQARAEQIPEEIEQETEAIRHRFADPQLRLFPVAVTYLVPEKFL
ncbi:MAG: helicase [Chloroflexi bacterium 54-19]|nr:MAG: helicase [Chloroflexi bacterium 54-19]